MPSIIKEFTTTVRPERVFTALTQQDEIAQWWTEDLSIKPEVGFIAEFRFQKWGAGVLQFEIAELHAGENVSWISRSGPPSWSETSVTWQLIPIQEGTWLVFTHDGFTQVNEIYETTRRNWDYFLESLKSYLETGKGTPGAPPHIR
jgi:uncharacterized protein YndB with AHSA1/START domain